MKVLFLGRSEFLYNTIKQLSPICEIIGIITAKASGEYTVDENSYKRLAEDLNVPFFLKNNIDSEVLEFCKKQKPDVVFSVNWVSVILDTFIKLFPFGVFNAHCGKLPNFKGNAIPNWSIILGESELPVNIHSMIGGVLDSGKIYKQQSIFLHPNTTIQDINFQLSKMVPELFRYLLFDIMEKTHIPLYDCTGAGGFRCYPRLPYYSKISWGESAQHIYNLIRASIPPYAAYCFYEFEGKLRKLYVIESEIINDESKDVAVPGHVLLNDKENGFSHIQTGKGVLALKRCVHDDDIDCEFKPGEKWKSTRMSLFISPEDYIYKILGAISD